MEDLEVLPRARRHKLFEKKQPASGFTLVELIVAMAVGIALVSIGVPAMGSLIGTNQIAEQANKFSKTIAFARSEAVKRRVPVVVCSSDDQAICSGSNDWSTGWIVFTDATGSESILDGEDILLMANSEMRENINFTTSVNAVRYRTTGTLSISANINYDLSTTNCLGNQRRTVSIRPQGYITIQKVSCS